MVECATYIGKMGMANLQYRDPASWIIYITSSAVNC